MSIKKTLYQVLEISANASVEEIRAAYKDRLQKLLAREAGMSLADFDYERKLLDLAQETLCDPLARQAYDEKLMARLPPPSSARQASSLALVPQDDPEVVARRAETVALRAEALALRMEVTALRAGAAPYDSVEPPQTFLHRFRSIFSGPLSRVVVAVATIAIVVIVMQMASFFFTVRKVEAVSAAASKAQERIEVQEYYQTHGVRPASAAEARMLDAEQQRLQKEESRKQADAYAEERERKRQEQEEKRFIEESRREAERVSANLRSAEEQAKREEERARRQREYEESRREAEERERVRQAQARWRNAASSD
jgi:hypothetical protein